jgi:hypothetical protein
MAIVVHLPALQVLHADRHPDAELTSSTPPTNHQDSRYLFGISMGDVATKIKVATGYRDRMAEMSPR